MIKNAIPAPIPSRTHDPACVGSASAIATFGISAVVSSTVGEVVGDVGTSIVALVGMVSVGESVGRSVI